MNSSTQRLYLYTVLSVVHICHLGIIICGHICQEKLTRLKLVSYRCVTDSEVYTNITSVPQQICIFECMSRKYCSVVNYNIEQNTCYLSNDACRVLGADQAFQMNYLGNIHRSECLQWLPTGTFNSIQAVSHPSCHFRLGTYRKKTSFIIWNKRNKWLLNNQIINGLNWWKHLQNIEHSRILCGYISTP